MNLSDDFSVKNYGASWYSWLFRQKFAFYLQKKFLYCNEILEHRPRGTFAAHSAKD